MIRHDLFNRFCAALKKEYGPDQVIAARDSSGVLVTSFLMPGEYEEQKTMIYLEIPEGFGYGVNVSNVFILLDKKKNRHHLIPLDNVASIVKRKFNLVIEKKSLKKRQWYWICFHPYGDRLYDLATGSGSYQKETSSEKITTDFIEYLLMVRAVLSGIAHEDKNILTALDAMNQRREDILLEQKEWIETVKLSKGWRKIKWLYD